jgi:phosphoglycerol transferase MdoB-like AlkP superfamily enzyme
MSSLTSPMWLLRDQFLTEDLPGHRHLRGFALAHLVPAALVAGLLYARDVQMTNADWLLAATSILTGLTFSMTTTFWSKSIDARSDPTKALNAQVLTILDENLTHLQWTVLVGVVSTATLALTSLLADPVTGAATWATTLCGGLVIYLITLVGVALHRFSEAAVILR